MNHYLSKHKKPFILSGLVLIAGLGMLSFKISGPQTISQQSPETINIDYAEKFEGFPESTKFNIQYNGKTNDQSREVGLISEDKHSTKTSFSKTDNITRQDRYDVTYLIQLPDENYIDGALQINKDQNKLKASLSGLKPGHKVSLSVNNQIYQVATPSDWTGQIEIDALSLFSFDAANICINISDKKSICHHSPVSERQVKS